MMRKSTKCHLHTKQRKLHHHDSACIR